MASLGAFARRASRSTDAWRHKFRISPKFRLASLGRFSRSIEIPRGYVRFETFGEAAIPCVSACEGRAEARSDDRASIDKIGLSCEKTSARKAKRPRAKSREGRRSAEAGRNSRGSAAKRPSESEAGAVPGGRNGERSLPVERMNPPFNATRVPRGGARNPIGALRGIEFPGERTSVRTEPTNARPSRQATKPWTAVERMLTRIISAGNDSPRQFIAGFLIVLGSALGIAVWLGAGRTEPWVQVAQGRSFSPETARRIQSALAATNITARVDARGRVAVAQAKALEAESILEKNKLIPPTYDQIRDESHAFGLTSLLEDPALREDRRNTAKEHELEALIENLDATIEDAHVRIGKKDAVKPRARSFDETAGARVFVLLDTRDNRAISTRTIDAIQTSLLTNVTGLAADGITLMDRARRQYLVAGDRAAGKPAMNQAREEELSERLETQLARLIEGVQVKVSLRAEDPASIPLETAARSESRRTRGARVAANRPISLEEPEESSSVAVAIPRSAPPTSKVDVLVLAPRSHYAKLYRRQSPGVNPSFDELQPIRTRVEETIRDTVRYTLSHEQIGEIKIDIYSDLGDEPIEVAAQPGGATSNVRGTIDWSIVAAGAGSAAVVAAFVGIAAAAKRNPRGRVKRAAAAAGSGHGATETGEPNYLDRVRELVRHEPIAAAGVLQRWIGQEERA